ncbi:Ankyrin repeat-containing domain protein [Akanthomyces lecanii RCEF 1005]|uniref:Ankyrin repeat-containing domain protein n=1 Tax=Akanthomyces lecanii RCEF 1005 TaxID=1081108 RepID=A0A167XLQ6_CORDF|nr:Ankyrin repeat-containing domain protein [Akanthomyces lecanii RCEF 1005]OAA65131.1 Ankyrin repeat-containing domain protein [Akanthomyces lecanii RCEF 1005]
MSHATNSPKKGSKDVPAPSKLYRNSDQVCCVKPIQELAKELAQSVAVGDIEGLQRALDSGADINGLHKHASKNDQQEYTYTPLQVAAHCGRVGAAEYLLKRGALVDSTNPDLDTAFSVAVDVGALKTAQLLRESGADVNHQNEKGYTPLHLLVRVDFEPERPGDVEMLSFLIQKCQVDVNVESKGGQTPLLLAARNKHREWFDMLARCERVELNKADRDGYTALYYAVGRDDKSLVKKLLDRGAKVDQEVKGDLLEKTSPLALAVRSELDKFMMLGPKESGDEDVKPKRDRLEMFRLLHDRGGNIKSKYAEKGKTLLHLATEQGRLDIVKHLIENEVDLHELDSDGNNALLIAVINDKPGIVELLCSHGSHLHHKNKLFSSALAIARERGFHDIITILEKANSSKHSLMKAE